MPGMNLRAKKKQTNLITKVKNRMAKDAINKLEKKTNLFNSFGVIYSSTGQTLQSELETEH